MVLNNTGEITIKDVNGNAIKCRAFRAAAILPDSDKTYYKVPIDKTRRLDLMAQNLYNDAYYQDLLLELNENPFFEWGSNDSILVVSERIASLIGT